jgi:hypothetical protein
MRSRMLSVPESVRMTGGMLAETGRVRKGSGIRTSPLTPALSRKGRGGALPVRV